MSVKERFEAAHFPLEDMKWGEVVSAFARDDSDGMFGVRGHFRNNQ